jgi:hypothetical protein
MIRRQLMVILVLFVLFSIQLWGSPQLVQMSDDIDWNPSAMSYIGTESSGTYRTLNLPGRTTPGNLLTAFVEINHTTSPPTVTLQSDDTTSSTTKGTFTLINPAGSCTANSRDLYMYYLPNVPSGGYNTIKVAFNSTNTDGGGPAVAEWSNIAQTNALDGTGYVCSGSTGSSGTYTFNAGSFTPSVSGDLMVEYAWDAYINNGGGEGVGAYYTAGTGWTKFVDSALWSSGGQWGVYNSTSAVNPSFTITPKSGIAPGALRIAAFFKPQAGAGGVPSGIRVIAKKNASNTSTGNGTPQFSFTSETVPFPCTGGNLMAANWAGPGNGADMSGVSDNLNGSWISNTSGEYCGGDPNNLPCVHNFSARNAITNQDQKLQLSFKVPSLDTAHLYCIAGAATPNPFDKAVTACAPVGTSSCQGNGSTNTPTLLSIQPSTSNGLVIMTASQGQNTTTGFSSPSGAIYQGCIESTEIAQANGGGCAANNTWGLFQNPDTSVESWTITTLTTNVLAQFAAEADAYKASAGGSPPSAPTNLTSTVK